MLARRGRSKIDSSDPRALRTRSKLVGAFHVAIADSDPSAMSVSSLTQAAGVNRTSFYSHFSSPEDLAIHALSELFDVVGNADIVMRGEHSVPAAEAAAGRCGTSSPSSGSGASPTPGCSGRARHRACARGHRGLRRTDGGVPGADGYPPAGGGPPVTAWFLAGGVLGVIGAWLADPDSPWSPDELVEALIQCLPGWLNTD